jgi:hypothetical protein
MLSLFDLAAVAAVPQLQEQELDALTASTDSGTARDERPCADLPVVASPSLEIEQTGAVSTT